MLNRPVPANADDSSLGYPISDEFPFFSVRISVFEHGYIEWSAQDGAHVH